MFCVLYIICSFIVCIVCCCCLFNCCYLLCFDSCFSLLLLHQIAFVFFSCLLSITFGLFFLYYICSKTIFFPVTTSDSRSIELKWARIFGNALEWKRVFLSEKRNMWVIYDCNMRNWQCATNKAAGLFTIILINIWCVLFNIMVRKLPQIVMSVMIVPPVMIQQESYRPHPIS